MITLHLDQFHVQQIAESGQCFRLNQIGENRYSVISCGHYLELSQNGTSISFNCSSVDFLFWEQYFDLTTDYGKFLSSVNQEDAYLLSAAKAGSGIRILNQDLWEMIITFVLSQQKTIPKIKEAVEALSRSYGSKKIWEGRTFYTFPDADQLAHASLEDLKALKLGYRAKYIEQICKDCITGNLNLEYLKSLTYEHAKEYLTGFYGIGEKVANCICLFGLHHIEAFPVDTWIKRILATHYNHEKYNLMPKTKRYPAIITDHFGSYHGYAGIMQQYIFYYERTILKGK